MEFLEFIQKALEEDIRDGDHTTLACIPENLPGKAILNVKEAGILAGMQVAEAIFSYLDTSARFISFKQDGARVEPGDLAFEVQAGIHTLLQAERLVLNTMQRMSGIATLTRRYTDILQPYKTILLDTRKTTPNFRWFEKQAVQIGGGQNHRFGLFDMILIKDNHIDFCGGIQAAIQRVTQYLNENKLALRIEIETRSLEEVKEVIQCGGVHRIMLDNFSPDQLREALHLINGQYETEASGGIQLDTIEAFAQTGVDFISAGAIIHHAVSLDLSLKAVL